MTILTVDDDPAICHLVKTTLGMEGQILTANSAKEAISVWQSCQGKVDLLITDVAMPEMNGMDLAKHLSAKDPGIAVLFMSGEWIAEVDEYARAGFVAKPFKPDTLVGEVRKLMLVADRLAD